MRIDWTTGETMALENDQAPPQELLDMRDAYLPISVPCEYGCNDVCEHVTDAAELMAGWCPNGNWSGGICRPTNNIRSNWMEVYGGARVLPVGECILLGTHNAGFDKHAPRAPSSETCQDVPIYDQLLWGIRVFDLRVQFFSGSSGPGRFMIYHSATNGRNVEVDVLQALLRYRRDAAADKEIVILDFHQFKDFNAAAHAEFCALIKRVLGSSIIPRTCMDAAIVQLWQLKKNTVVAYNGSERDAAFWGGVSQRWIGSNTPSRDQMAAFIARVGSEPKPFGELRSVQAAYYSMPFFVPKDLSGDVMGWFAATSSGGPISDHFIINTDWSLRCRMADNVIYGNDIRARRRNAHVILSSPNQAGPEIQTMSYGIYNVANANWASPLTFAANTSGYTSVQVITSDADWPCELRYGGHVRQIKKGDRLVFKVKNGSPPQFLDHFSDLQ